MRTTKVGLAAVGLCLALAACSTDAPAANDPAASAGASGSADATEPANAGIPGTLYYAVGGPGAYEVRKVVAGVVSPVTKLPAGVEVYRISPDGTKVAYQVGRKLQVGPVDGSSSVVIADLATQSDIDWSPDSTQIAYASWSPMTVNVMVSNADGSGTHQVGTGDYPVWSPDGGWIAFADFSFDGTTGAFIKVTVVQPDGSGSRSVNAALPAGQTIWGVQSVSNGGGEVFLASECPQCANRLLPRDYKGQVIVDTTTGAARTPSVTGGVAEMVFWLADGSTLVRIATTPAPPQGGWASYDVELRAPDGTVTARAPEPLTIHGHLFGYTP